ncbi:STAS domain-containing protein [Streptomyces sp. NPDC020707]|jgi:ABC-type transporter Mla MlaB component|uniref:STAS domain-containing protein n=1 Tax=Streptomyces ortus TaxID=2867268 RepID=A0ABT3V6S9_9ACTN|nr:MULTISPECIES: STAS domain-containing protein [Streptomyces]MCX4234076.1 STAS domain-containing protein [Streptomyces ortus]
MSSAPHPGLPHVDAKTPAVLVLPGPVTKDDVPRLCEAVRTRLQHPAAHVVVLDVKDLGPPGLTTVDALARMQLTARRAGGRLRLRAPDPALRALLALVALPFELEGQPEQREPPLRVEEAVEPGDPPL